MKKTILSLALLGATATLSAQPLILQDDFEGNGTINSWFGDDCGLNTALANPVATGINTSATVLEYNDQGGTFANVRFDAPENFDLSEHATFTFKIYIPSSSLTGNQPNQVSVKLQDGSLNEPWSTQSEIIKTLVTDQWQEVSADFINDTYTNLDPNSPAPSTRTDFNRVLIQVNGEDNSDLVIAYIDDVLYDGSFPAPVVFDQLVWSDEFDTDGAVDDTKWFHQTLLPNGDSWFNGEVQHYTDRTENASIENGILSITARRETFTDQGVTKDFTSARLNSKFAFQYGRVEVRAKMPFGVGTWPAIWMLGKNIDEAGGYWDLEGFGTTPWPACGEIDIMEHWGNNQNFVQSATHTPSSFGGTINKGGQIIPTTSTDFHVYSLEWTAEKLVFTVDDVVHYTYDPAVKDADTWPFDAEQYMLFNVAILPEIEPGFTSSPMEVDYIRIYQESDMNTSVAELETNELDVFPMPFTNTLTVQLGQPQGQPTPVRLYSLDGRFIDSWSIPAQQTQWVLSGMDNLAPGLYLLQSETNGQLNSQRIIKQ